MESVYMPHKTHPNVSDVLDLSNYFLQYSSTLENVGAVFRKPNKKITLMNLLNIDSNQLDELKKRFSVNNYSWKGKKLQEKLILPVQGFKTDFKLYGVPDNDNLKSLNHLRSQTKEDESKRKRLLRYTGQIDCEDNIESEESDKQREKLRENCDYLVTVRVYLPNPHCSFTQSKRSKQFQLSQELLLHGEMCLDELRDRILCAEDYQSVEGDVSLNPFVPTTVRCGDVYKSAMFFINDIFYIDSRHVDHVDYSEVIKKWTASKNINLRRTESMEKFVLSSLQFRLGYPYLYMHQGNCEHIIVFTDARLVNRSDMLVRIAYPLMVSYASLRGRQCMMCSRKTAKFIVVDTVRLPIVKTHLCGLCLYQYCYVDGKKTDDFTVYKYLDRVALL